MITATSKLRNQYDTIIVGGGISGLLIARQLQEAGQSTLVVDRGESPGGHCRLHKNQHGEFPHGLKIVPNLYNAESSLEFLASQLSEPLSWQKVERPAITFEAGFKPYYGFGDEGPDYSNILDYYTQTEVFELSHQPHEWITQVFNSYHGDYLAQAFVTKFICEDNRLRGVIINGSKTVPCENIVFCAQPKDLPILLGEEAVPSKMRRALGKTRQWTSLAYDVFFDEVITDQLCMHLLTGSKDKTIACVGLFHRPDELGQQHSQWLTFMPSDQTEDTEAIADSLKWVQKQIKRAYPNSFEHKMQDRILVSSASHGQLELPLTGHQTLAPFDNLWVASSFVQPVPNLLGAINQVRLVLAAMGFAAPFSEKTTDAEL